jgi:metal-responsive CopG/Arc/MetJ family transcriptional regulator
MALTRTNVTLPEELLRQVDEIAGRRGRSRYVAEAVARQVRSDMQRKVFEEAWEAAGSLPNRLSDHEALAFAKDLRASW